MANGRPAVDVVGVLEWAKQNVTKVGAVGAGVYVGSCFVHAAIHHSWDEAATALGYAGIALLVSGAAFRSKRAADILVTTQAENKIQNPALAPSSADPAVQRAIDKMTGNGEAHNGRN